MDKEKFANIVMTEFFDEDFDKHKSYKTYLKFTNAHNKLFESLNEEQQSQFFVFDDLLWKYFTERENEILLFAVKHFKNIEF